MMPPARIAVPPIRQATVEPSTAPSVAWPIRPVAPPMHTSTASPRITLTLPREEEVKSFSIVLNPHKWLFTPVDCSLLYVRDVELLRSAFSLVPEYLRTPEAGVTNLMDYGIQLGRRFRALKLWMVIRGFGAEGLRERIRHHCALGRAFAAWVDAEPGFEVVAPVPFSTVCFRATGPGSPEDQDARNERILTRVNDSGQVFLSHTKLRGRIVLRLTVGNLRTTGVHVERAWALIREAAALG